MSHEEDRSRKLLLAGRMEEEEVGGGRDGREEERDEGREGGREGGEEGGRCV